MADLDDRPCADLTCRALLAWGVHWHWPAWGVLATKGDRLGAMMMFNWWPASRERRRA